jgi:hypothetical protein
MLSKVSAIYIRFPVKALGPLINDEQQNVKNMHRLLSYIPNYLFRILSPIDFYGLKVSCISISKRCSP